MKRRHYFIVSAAYVAIMTASWIWIEHTVKEGGDQTTARIMSSIVLVVGFFHLNRAGLARRSNIRASSQNRFLETNISPIGIVTFASMFGLGASLILIPGLAFAFFLSQNISPLIVLLPCLLLYLPMTKPSNSEEPETRKVPQ